MKKISLMLISIILSARGLHAAANIEYPPRVLLTTPNSWQSNQVFNGSVTVNGSIILNGQCFGTGCGGATLRGSVFDLKVLTGILPSNVNTSTTVYVNTLLVEDDMIIEDILEPTPGPTVNIVSGRTIIDLTTQSGSLPDNTRTSETIYTNTLHVSRNMFIGDILQ